MTAAWDKGSHPNMPRIRSLDWFRIFWRAAVLIVLVFGGLIILLLVRLIERPVNGMNRPWTPFITQFVCRNALHVLGIRLSYTGVPMAQRGAVVANHSSWLDIFALNAVARIYFVSKSEVARWPGIGWLARATGTVFIERNAARAREQTALFQQRLMAGHTLLFFPEGTSTDGQQVLTFKTTLFQSFYGDGLRDHMHIQPVAVMYGAPQGMDHRFYGWWGSMEFGSHLLATLAPARQGEIRLAYCTPLRVADFENRKALAAACESSVRAAHQTLLGAS